MALRWRSALVVAGLAATAAAQSTPPAATRTYAVLSAIGDALTVVTYRPAGAGSVDANRQETIPMPDAPFDNVALLAVDRALQKVDAGASAVFLKPSARMGIDDADRLSPGQRMPIPADLAEALHSAVATHLILITRYRADTRVRTASHPVGSGKLAGLGFYVDRRARTIQAVDGERGTGFLAPYVYIRLSLIDVATSSTLREVLVTTAIPVATEHTKDAVDPWSALSAREKLGAINQILEDELSRAVPALVASTP